MNDKDYQTQNLNNSKKDVLEDMAAKIVCGIDTNADYLKKYLREAAGYLSDFYFTMGQVVYILAAMKNNN